MTSSSPRTPPRVAFVLHVMQIAGAEVLVYETIRRLGARIEPTVFCLDAVGPLGEQLTAAGVPVVAFHRRPGFDWSIVGRMKREIRARGIDVVHAHQYTPFFYSSMAARWAARNVRVILTEHGRHFPDIVSVKRRWANRLVFDRLADDITAVCHWSARSLVEKDGFSESRTRVIPNGIDVDRYERREDRAALRRRLGLHPSRRYVVSVARFHRVKDHATLLNAFRAVAVSRADVDLLLVGDGPLRGDIERQIGELGISDRVRLVGVRSDVPDWLFACDVFTLSSASEAASITLLEAMACGLPVVVTAVGGNPELVRDGVEGLLVPRGDAAAFGSALTTLLDDLSVRETMGRAGAARVRLMFRLDQAIEAYAGLYAKKSRG